MTTTTATNDLDRSALDELATQLRGDVLTRSDPEYDAARRVYNAMVDRHPACIVRCRDVADVIAAVRFARARGVPLAVRGGGHSAAGYSMVDDALVIDLQGIDHVVVSPDRTRVHVGGGCLWADVDHATSPFGRVVPSGVVSTTGVAGLTLGGGTGHLTRALGLTCDSLVAADMVTVDGELVRASESERPELFWALRGGGGNFGIVVDFEFRLHEVGPVLGGPIFYDVDAAEHLLAHFRDVLAAAPDELGAFFGFAQAPPLPMIPDDRHGTTVGLVAACWSGAPDDGRDVVAPLLDHPAVIGDGLATLSMAELDSATDALAPQGMRNYWKGQFIDDLTPDLIAVHAAFGPALPTPMSTMHLYPLGGAAGRVAPQATAFGHRDAGFSTVVAALWADPADDDAAIGWVRDYWGALHACAPTGGYVNFLTGDEAESAVLASYGQNHERLAAVKLAYDPLNTLCHNANIRPAPPGDHPTAGASAAAAR